MSKPFDALLLVSFGGPECREDVIPFLENVTRGKNVPRERLLEVAEHYYHFGGASPINQQNRELTAALRTVLADSGRHLPIYWGNRNWHPMIPDAIRRCATTASRGHWPLSRRLSVRIPAAASIAKTSNGRAPRLAPLPRWSRNFDHFSIIRASSRPL